MQQATADVGNCHELLLRLAGRLPDKYLWRLRDWLSVGSLDSIARLLPLTLLREHIAITPQDLRALTGLLGREHELLTALQDVEVPQTGGYLFSATPPESLALGDRIGVVLSALTTGSDTIESTKTSWRSRWGGAASKRVVLVELAPGQTGASAARLTGQLQRVLRALGEVAPAVEVLPHDVRRGGYHRDALAASEPAAESRPSTTNEPAYA